MGFDVQTFELILEVGFADVWESTPIARSDVPSSVYELESVNNNIVVCARFSRTQPELALKSPHLWTKILHAHSNWVSDTKNYFSTPFCGNLWTKLLLV